MVATIEIKPPPCIPAGWTDPVEAIAAYVGVRADTPG
jgi:hypothetical protein